jgi:uncharacterized protein YggE
MRAFVLATAVFCVPTAALADAPLERTITVEGEATVYADPDHASIDLGVETSAGTVGAALASNNEKMARVLAALKGAGVAKNEVQTATFQIAPLHPLLDKSSYQYDYARVTGYQVTNKLTVTVSDLTKTGTIIDAAANAGANSSNSVVFEIKNRDVLLDKVRAEAMRNARHKAEVMAGAVGAEVGGLVSVGNPNARAMSYDNAPPPPPPPPAPGTSILPGQLSVSASVTAVFALK